MIVDSLSISRWTWTKDLNLQFECWDSSATEVVEASNNKISMVDWVQLEADRMLPHQSIVDCLIDAHQPIEYVFGPSYLHLICGTRPVMHIIQ